MFSPYLIEIRLFGRAKEEIREITKAISEKYKIPISQHIVPHITLIGGFSTTDENQLIKDFNLMCCCNGLFGYIIEGKGAFYNNGVIYSDVRPSEELINFRRELRDRLKKYCILPEIDFKEPFMFHVTILNHVDKHKIKYIMQNFDFDRRYSHRMLRVTLLKNGKILKEYDFCLRRMLNRNEALEHQILMETFNIYKQGKIKKNISLWRKLLCYIRFLFALS
jgi:2'-5' RNA ligase